MLRGRPTIDIVIILMASMVAAVLILATVGSIISKMTHPELDLHGAEQAVGNIVTTVVGALVGFVGGRATGRMEEAKANGAKQT